VLLQSGPRPGVTIHRGAHLSRASSRDLTFDPSIVLAFLPAPDRLNTA
jgi:hypothetical protein